MEKFHNDILENILFRIPCKPALQARRVCKTWRNLLANRRYKGLLFAFRPANKEIQLYYGEHYDRIHVDKKNYYYSYEELIKLNHGMDIYKDGMCNLVGSCNGLVCFRIGTSVVYDSFLVCNPLTGEFVVLPRIRLEAFGFSKAVGFGYCRSTNNYKVVQVINWGQGWINLVPIPNKAYVQVCTIGSGWRNVVSIPNKVSSSAGIFVNGALHWLDDDDIEPKTLTFDLEDEKFRFLPRPPSEARHSIFSNVLKLLGANLCLVQTNSVDGHINIWAYKTINGTASYDMKGYGQKSDYYNKDLWNWRKEFSIEVDECFMEPFAITRSNEVLLWRGRSFLYCYDPTASTLSKICDNGMGCSQAVAIPHTISLISLKDPVENAAGDYNYSKTVEAVTLY